MTADPIETLFAAYDAGLTRLPMIEAQRALGGSAWHALSEAGILGEPLVALSGQCQACTQAGHEEPVKFDAVRSAYVLWCPEAGEVLIRPESIECSTFDHGALRRLFTTVLNIENPHDVLYENGNLIFVGEGLFDDVLFCVFVARRLADPEVFAAVLDRQNDVGPSPGIILCSRRPALPPSRSTRHAFVEARLLLDFDGSGFVVRPSALRQALSQNPKIAKTKSRGDIAFNLIDRYLHDNARLPSVRELEAYARYHWPAGSEPLKRSQLNKYLDQYRKQRGVRPVSGTRKTGQAKPDT